LIPVALPTPEFPVYASDLEPEVRQRLEKLSHPRIGEIILHQAVLRLFEALGFDPYISIGLKLRVKLIGLSAGSDIFTR
jgi:hypothetical protein